MKKALLFLSFLFSIQTISAQFLGSLDTTFGTKGRVVTQPVVGSNTANCMVIQPDGKIIVAGKARIDTFRMEVVRYNINGTLDSTFGKNGIVTTVIKAVNNMGKINSGLSAIALQNDGKIVATGLSDLGFAVVRYNTDGSLDTSFDGDGIATTSFGSDVYAGTLAITIQTDNKIMVGGYQDFSGQAIYRPERCTFARYNPNGTLDTSFNKVGILTLNIDSTKNCEVQQMALQTDNKSLVGAYVYGDSMLLNTDLALLRLNINGTLDATFGTNGKVLIPQLTLRSLRVLNDGKILVAGQSSIAGRAVINLYKFTNNGLLDPSFGTNGKIVTAIDSNIFINDMVVQKDGKIVAMAFSSGELYFNSSVEHKIFILRYNSNGTLDNTFGTNGKTATPTIYKGEGYDEIAQQTDGKIVAYGGFGDNTNYNFIVARFHNTDNTVNDSCQNAIFLNQSIRVTGTTLYATGELNTNRVLPCETNQNVKDVWYKFRSDTGVVKPLKMQLTFTKVLSSVPFKYAIYAGSCSDFVIISDCKTVTTNQLLDTITLLEANQDYYIRVWSTDSLQSALFSVLIQPQKNIDSSLIAHFRTVNSCQPFSSINVSTANSQKWLTLMDSTGVVAEINPNGNLLGQITGGYFINSTGTIRRASGTPYLDRNIGIKVTNQPTTDVSIRLYMTSQELFAYLTVVGSNPTAITHYAGALCASTVQSGSGDLLPATLNVRNGLYYVEFATRRFSGFFLGPNKSLVSSDEINQNSNKF